MIDNIKKLFKKITKYIYSSIFLLLLLVISILYAKDNIIEGFDCSNLKIKIEMQFFVDEFDESNPPVIDSLTVDNVDDNGNVINLNEEEVVIYSPTENNPENPDSILFIEDIFFKTNCTPITNRITFLHKNNASYSLVKLKISSGNTTKTVDLKELEIEDNEYYAIDFEPLELKNFIS